jgi:hypothetical protein
MLLLYYRIYTAATENIYIASNAQNLGNKTLSNNNNINDIIKSKIKSVDIYSVLSKRLNQRSVIT